MELPDAVRADACLSVSASASKIRSKENSA
jgi:hypothetical protein